MSITEKLNLADKLFDYFSAKYGPDRALWICTKLVDGNISSLEDGIRIGEKIHAFNLILTGKR